ncbi:MAG: M23 family metallopeptidase, partial [Pyrinomonadaceae bacterium]
SLKNGTRAEQQTKEQLERLFKSHDLSKWTMTKSILIDEKTSIPHSHPVLTLNTSYLKDDELLLATYVHEQIHWFVIKDQTALAAAIKDFKAMFPTVPAGGPEGARDESSTYLHIAVCYLEYTAMRELMGVFKAKQIMDFWATHHYTWIYRTVSIRRRDIGNIMFKHKLIPTEAAKTEQTTPTETAPIEYLMIHPIVKSYFMCGEHWEGQLKYQGDALGADCMVTGGLSADESSGFSKPYKTDGKTNEDWYGWMEPVLAPISGTVARVNINPVVNKPGELGKPPASFVVFKHDDGTMVLIAHVAEITVKEGDKVIAGQPFAKIGNNGFGRNPHVHIGAWRDKTPLQIRFDLRAAARLHNKQAG